MTSETTPNADERDDGKGEESGVADRGFAEPVDEESTGSDEDTEGSLRDALVAGADPAGALAALESEDPLRIRALRLTLSSCALLGFVLVFGSGAGALLALSNWLLHVHFTSPLAAAAETTLLAGGALLVPAATFLFVAWYDDATLRWPSWPDGHPPLGDAWLLVMLAYGLATMALSTPTWPYPVVAGGWLAAFAGAYLVLPVWLGWRCLEEESWVLGTLAGMTALMVPALAYAAAVVLVRDGATTGNVAVALTVALVGLGLPFAFARWSPGPVALSRLAAAGLSRGVELLCHVGHRLGASA